jgi:hypothetical protein
MTFSEEPDWAPDEGSPEQDPKWRIYEKVVADCKAKYPDCQLTRNHFIVGRRSTVRRQVDVWVTANIAGHEVKLAIECRCYGRKIGIKDMDAFCGFLDDVSAKRIRPCAAPREKQLSFDRAAGEYWACFISRFRLEVNSGTIRSVNGSGPPREMKLLFANESHRS